MGDTHNEGLGEGLTVFLDGAGKLADYEGIIERGSLKVVLALPGGMASGAPSVGLVVETPEGRAIYAETSLRLFLGAARAFRAKYLADFPDLP